MRNGLRLSERELACVAREFRPLASFDSTFVLLPSSSSFELKQRHRTVEDQTEKISRAQESSLDPLSRSFRSFPYSNSPRLPHSPLPRSLVMQNRSRTRSVAFPNPSQSVAALLPLEIVDCIFSHFDFSYSVDATGADGTERTGNLSNMSVIAEGWKGPARRRLCRTVRIVRWEQLAEGVPEWARGGLQTANIQHTSWEEVQPHKAANALFKFFQHAPNLRVLKLSYPPFQSFDAGDSTLMRTTHFLPFLDDLTVDSQQQVPHSVIYDILATSNRQISRLRLWSGPVAVTPISDERLDFGGNLRYLHIEGHSSTLNGFQPLPSSLDGLKELSVERNDEESDDRARELLAEVAPNLEKLTIDDGDVTEVVGSLSLLLRLTRLSLPSFPASPNSLPLPPSLVSLHFKMDDHLLPLFDRWTATPSLLPATLHQIAIGHIRDFQTLERLPHVARFGIVYHERLVGFLRRLSPRTSPFKALEVLFGYADLDKVAVVDAECERLEVEFHRTHKRWE